MTPRLFIPAPSIEQPRDAIAFLTSAPADRPFSQAATEFCADLSRVLFRAGMKNRPEVQALAYWCRPSEVARLKSSFEQLTAGPSLLRAARHGLPCAPGQCRDAVSIRVDPRHPLRQSECRPHLLARFHSHYGTLRHGRIGTRTIRRAWAHQSRYTVRPRRSTYNGHLRLLRLADCLGRRRNRPRAQGRALAARRQGSLLPRPLFLFSDPGGGVLASPDAQKEALAHAFYNDCYWFDQMACSSGKPVSELKSSC